MAAIDWTNVTNIAPELSAVVADAQTDILAYVNSAFNVTQLGGEESSRLKLARTYLAAHIGTMVSDTATAGPVVAETVGSVSRTYANLASAEQLGGSRYGTLLSQILKRGVSRLPFTI